MAKNNDLSKPLLNGYHGFFLQSQHILGKKCALSCTLYQRNATGPPYLDTDGVCNLSLTVLRKQSHNII